MKPNRRGIRKLLHLQDGIIVIDFGLREIALR
jgi:hypothetical protein